MSFIEAAAFAIALLSAKKIPRPEKPDAGNWIRREPQ
jgi:hypothetical protein